MPVSVMLDAGHGGYQLCWRKKRSPFALHVNANLSVLGVFKKVSLKLTEISTKMPVIGYFCS